MTAKLDVASTFRGKHLLMTGVTGFVGKAFLAWMIVHHPDVRKITCIVRPKARQKPVTRLESVIASEPLKIARDSLGEQREVWIAERLDAVQGDLAKPLVGLSSADVERLKGDVDVLINIAASVDFTPPLNDAVTTNCDGALGALELARTLGVPYTHVSTCFVAGYTNGFVPEEIRPNECPNREIDDFDPEKELLLTKRLIARILEDRDDPTLPAPRRRLRTEGEARSRALGWPNTYTFTKALAEKLISLNAGDVPYTVVRPAIVESAWKFPLPGWSEGGNGTAACVLIASLGQRFLPGKPDLVLDVVPVDLVAKGLALAVAALMNGLHAQVYQLGTSDLRPLEVRRITELVNVWRHKQADAEDVGFAERLWLTTTDSVVSRPLYELAAAPTVSKLSGWVSGWLKDAPVKPGGPAERAVQRAKARVEAVERTARGVEAIYEVYQPFMFDVDVRYKTRAIVRTAELLEGEERELYAYDADKIDWYQYWQEIHLPGLDEWIFPEMRRKLKQGITPDPVVPAPIPGDLLDLLERSAIDHRDRIALARAGGRPERWTYADLHDRAVLVARRLVQAGVAPGDRVLVHVERGPEWPIAYFGALYAGATAVPVDPGAPAETVARLGERSGAKVWIVSRSLAPVAAGVSPVADDAGETPATTAPTVLVAEQVIRSGTEDLPPLPALERDPKRPASILFTSGTTGVPRGVVLSHSNFLAVLRGVHGVYGLGPDDRFLSLLPLHHSFEFTAGLLFPLSRGASIHYPPKITADTLPALLEEVRPTAMVGVPAVWSLLSKRVVQQIDDMPAPLRKLWREAERISGELRDRFGVNLGPYLFLPVHRGLGGELAHLVSGGAALPEGVLRDFWRWGFDLTSGYGLTETSPVLTVSPPGTKRGDTVGPPIVGVDVKIFEPGPDGVGEIVARGPNLMQGYLDDPEGTAAVVRGGWLHTGDLGRLDGDGNLAIVGRRKDVIVAASGENVYPDELEDRLDGVEGVRELAVIGLPDGQGGERVVLVVIPDDETAVGRPDAETALRRAIAARTADLPAYWRPQEIRFRNEALPRTSTLKVSRAQVRDECAAGPRAADEGPVEVAVVPEGSRWLVDAIARAAGKRPGEVHAASRFGDDLSLDSLALLDLVTLIERRTGSSPPPEELAALPTVADVVEAVTGRATRRSTTRVPLFFGADGRPAESPTRGLPLGRLPDGLREQAAAITRRLHAEVTGRLFDIEVTGQGYLPDDRPVLVVSNHASHVDSGVLRHALGKLGEDLPLLAAQDYFFGTPLKDLVFGDLLDLVPADRHKSGVAGVRAATRILESGRSLAIFPEGTRSRDGALDDFRPGAILIALQAGVDILPVHIEGSHEVLPPGSSVPRPGGSVRVRIGRPIPHELLERRVRAEGLPMQEAADLLRESLLSLARGGDSLTPWFRSLGVVGGGAS